MNEINSKSDPVDALKQTLRDAELPPIPDSLWSAKVRTRNRWMLPTGFAAATSTVALAAAFLFVHPTVSEAAPSLGQVDAAQAAARSFKVIYKLGPQGGSLYQVEAYRDGDKWKVSMGSSGGNNFGQTVMDGTQTTIIRTRPHRPPVVFIDGPTPPPKRLQMLPNEHNFFATPSEVFRSEPGKVSVEHDVSWNGRKVDRFSNLYESHLTFKSGQFKGNHTMKFTATLIADSESHLPLELRRESISFDKMSLAETFLYTYDPLPADTFLPTIPEGSKIIKVRDERIEAKRRMGKNGLVIVDGGNTAGVFLPDRPDILRSAKAHTIRVRFGQGPLSYTYPGLIQFDDKGNPNKNAPWHQMMILTLPPVAPKGYGKTAKVYVNGELFTMPVMKVEDVWMEFRFPGQSL